MDRLLCQMEKLQLQRSKSTPFPPAEKKIISEDFLRSLRGCRVEKLRFEKDARSGVSYITFHVTGKGDSINQAEILLFDRNGYHYFDGREETFLSTVRSVTLLRREILLQKAIEISDIQIMDLQDAVQDRDRCFRSKTLCAAFVQITLRWGQHTIIFGNLLEDMIIGISRDMLSPLSLKMGARNHPYKRGG